MSKWSFGYVNWSAVAVADTTNFVNAQFQIIKGGLSTHRIELEEVYMTGLAAASATAFMCVARDSTVGATPVLAATASHGPLDVTASQPATVVLVATNTTTLPQRQVQSAVDAGRLNLGFNAFGGIVRWVAAPYERYCIYGTAVNAGEMSLTALASSTTASITSHLIYELI